MKRYIITFSLLLLSLTSCSDFLDEDLKSSIEADGFFDSEASAELVVNGVYSTLTDTSDWGTYNVNLMVMNLGSFGYLNNNTDTRHTELMNYTLGIDHASVEQIYTSSYYTIQQANYAIDGVETMEYSQTGISDTTKARLIAECKFMRALSYFNLVRLYGGVPLVTEPTTDMDERYVARSSIMAVYKQIIADLKYASENLYYKQGSAVTPCYDVSVTGRATRSAALGLLAKVYLTAASTAKHSDLMGSWNTLKDGINSYDWVDIGECYTLSAEYARQLISLSDSGQINVSLNSDYGYLFTPAGENSAESLFEIQFGSTSGYGGRMGCWVGLLGLTNVYSRRIMIDPELYNLYDKAYITGTSVATSSVDEANTDARLLWNIPGYKVANSVRTVVKKWSDMTYFKYRLGEHISTANNSPSNYVVLRYADILLGYAEALNELGYSAMAVEYLNKIRSRARNGISCTTGMGDYWTLDLAQSNAPADLSTSLSYDEVLAEVIAERRRELAAEGHSRFDDIRFGLYMSNGEGRKDWSDANPTAGGTVDFYQVMANTAEADREAITNPSTVSTAAANVRDYQQFFPIPKRERDINPNLVQNPSWN